MNADKRGWNKKPPFGGKTKLYKTKCPGFSASELWVFTKRSERWWMAGFRILQNELGRSGICPTAGFAVLRVWGRFTKRNLLLQNETP
jgi:hypothetical protein